MPALANPTIFDRLWRDFRALVRGELVELQYLGTYEFAVDVVNGDNTIDGACTDPSVTIPPISHCPPMPGLLAETVTPAQGMLCAVIFLNGKPTNPRVVAYYGGSAPSVSNIFATQLNLGSASGSPAARVNDTVAVIFPPLIQFTAVSTVPPFSLTGVLTITQPAVGVVQTGSSSTNIGG